LERSELDHHRIDGGSRFCRARFRAEGLAEPQRKDGGSDIMILNWRLAKHPMNYVIITLMLVIAGIAGHLVLSWMGLSPAESAGQPMEKSTPASTPVNLRTDGAFQAISVGQ
jgi:hypothetical protein